MSNKGEQNGMFGVHRYGEANPFFGQHHTEETKEKNRQAHLGNKHTEEQNLENSNRLKGRVPYWLIGKELSEEHKLKLKANVPRGKDSPHWKGGEIERVCQECEKHFRVCPALVKYGRAKFCSQQCSMTNRRKRGDFGQSPNKSEQILIDLFSQNNLPFKFVGNGEVWLGNRNPDFINTNGKKQVIEFLGTHWHPLFDEARKVEHYKKYGFDCLIIWEDELANPDKVAIKTKRFERVKKCKL